MRYVFPICLAPVISSASFPLAIQFLTFFSAFLSIITSSPLFSYNFIIFTLFFYHTSVSQLFQPIFLCLCDFSNLFFFIFAIFPTAFLVFFVIFPTFLIFLTPKNLLSATTYKRMAQKKDYPDTSLSPDNLSI